MNLYPKTVPLWKAKTLAKKSKDLCSQLKRERLTRQKEVKKAFRNRSNEEKMDITKGQRQRKDHSQPTRDSTQMGRNVKGEKRKTQTEREEALRKKDAIPKKKRETRRR